MADQEKKNRKLDDADLADVAGAGVPEERVTGFGTLPNWMLETLRRGEEIAEWTDYINVKANPTLATDCADAMMAIFLKKKQGIFHCCGRDSITRVELGRQVAKAFGLDPSKVRTATEVEMDPGILSSPLPIRTSLDATETERILERTNLGIEEGLQEWKRQVAEPVK